MTPADPLHSSSNGDQLRPTYDICDKREGPARRINRCNKAIAVSINKIG